MIKRNFKTATFFFFCNLEFHIIHITALEEKPLGQSRNALNYHSPSFSPVCSGTFPFPWLAFLPRRNSSWALLFPFSPSFYIWLICPKGESSCLLFDAVLGWVPANTCCSKELEMHTHSAPRDPNAHRALLTKASLALGVTYSS